MSERNEGNSESALRATARRIVVGVTKKTALLTAVAVGGVFIARIFGQSGDWWQVPLGIIFGSAVGVLNFHWLATAAEQLHLRQGMTPGRIVGIAVSALKLPAIFVILFIVIRWKLLHIIAVVGGLSVCFLAILWEGLVAIVPGTQDREGRRGG
jgi:hypothetical protein